MAKSVDRSHTCCICLEVYDEFDSQPLVWPCIHSFCKRCLQQMLAQNDKPCLLCGRSWTKQAPDSPVFMTQLVHSEDQNENIASKPTETELPPKNVCENHVFAFWCNSCKISVCGLCLFENHKECDWIPEKNKIDELRKALLKTTESTRKDLTDFLFLGTTYNTTNLSNVRRLIKKLQEYEKYFISLEASIPIEKDAAINRLEELENQPVDASVADYTTAISNSTFLLDELFQYPTILNFSFPPKLTDCVMEEIAELKNSVEDTWNEVSAKHNFCQFLLNETLIDSLFCSSVVPKFCCIATTSFGATSDKVKMFWPLW